MACIASRPGSGRAWVVLLTLLWLVPVEIPPLLPSSGPVDTAAAEYVAAQDPGGQNPGGVDPFGQVPGDDPDAMPRPVRSKAKAARKKGVVKKAEPRPKGKAKDTAVADSKKAAESGRLSFSQDIAPIMVANCVGCHSKDGAGAKRGKLDLSTFEKLQKGAADHAVIVAGKPDESHLVLRINGEEDPKMPQGNNRALSADAIAKITQWVKEGARLDAGLDPKVPMDSYAASPEQLRRRQLAQMPAKERDAKVLEVGQARWKQSNAKQKPEVVPGGHFIMFSNLPNDRATSALKGLEAQYSHLRRLLGPAVMDWAEKASLYVFNTNNEYVEFIRSVEGRDVDTQERFSVRFNVAQPYVAAVDPAGGKKEEPSAARRKSRGKRGEDSDGAGPERSLLGVLTEAVASGSVASAGGGAAPRWLREGIGAYMAHQVEPRSPYYHRLRQTAAQNVQQGWQTKANQALGGSDQISAEDLRAISFAVVDCMMKTEFLRDFPAFLHGMIADGQGALDDMLKKVYNGTRDEFLNYTEAWVAGSYGRNQ